MKSFKTALCQNKPGYDKKANIERALIMLDQAVNEYAKLIIFPEMFFYPYEIKNIPAVAEQNFETLKIFQKKAKEYQVHLCTGSMAIQENDQIYNRAYLIDPTGQIILEYSKMHLFDVDLPSLKVLESSVFTPGNELKVAKTDLGKIGLLICFDIRFPELARKLTLMGAEMIIVPAAFNTTTGPAHWHINMRMRAVENQVYLAAVSPARNSHTKYHAYGHSLLIDPWGEIKAEADIDEEIIYGNIDLDYLAEIRSRLPLLKHRRPELY
ncbi:MAG: carbon-nitrogen hydrolase family protein [Spirochaetes bacterium]|nr:carbon-nitrogen hydrolase family protein [Spirochaetota bacterium]